MGIAGLLPLLEKALRDVNVSILRGKRVAVDGYCWLHRGANSCAEELCLGNAANTTKYLQYVNAMLDLLDSVGAVPTVVLDGGYLPAKANQEEVRAERRRRGTEEARHALARGDRQAAHLACCKAVDVTPEMAAKCIQLLRSRKVAFVVAPFEADAQLAFLARSGSVDVVITEDSDMVPYGVPVTLFKLDKTGTGKMLILDDVLRITDFRGMTLLVCFISFEQCLRLCHHFVVSV